MTGLTGFILFNKQPKQYNHSRFLYYFILFEHEFTS